MPAGGGLVVRAGLSARVQIRVGDALETLPQLATEKQQPFDFVFIDADRANLAEYFDWAVKLSRQGGVIIVDLGDDLLRVLSESSPGEYSLTQVRDPFGHDRAGFSARAVIDRKEFGITFNQVLDHGGLALGELVTIDIDVEATRIAAKSAA